MSILSSIQDGNVGGSWILLLPWTHWIQSLPPPCKTATAPLPLNIMALPAQEQNSRAQDHQLTSKHGHHIWLPIPASFTVSMNVTQRPMCGEEREAWIHSYQYSSELSIHGLSLGKVLRTSLIFNCLCFNL